MAVADSIACVGKNVRLVPFTAAHITTEYLSWLNNKHLMRFSRQRLRTHTTESSLGYLSSFPGSPNFFWAVERLSDGLHVGTMTTYVDTHHQTADLGIMIGHAAAAGTGCGKEAWGLALAHGFGTLSLRKITGGTAARNEGMVKIFRHWNMVLEGTQRQQELLDDGPVDILLFGLLRAEWTGWKGARPC
jgi:ribosomal-protein-alanine N-acetyltransferase